MSGAPVGSEFLTCCDQSSRQPSNFKLLISGNLEDTWTYWYVNLLCQTANARTTSAAQDMPRTRRAG